jgi:hypothetical protein
MGLAELTPALKKRLLTVLTIRLTVKGEERVLFDVLAKLALSLASVIEGRRRSLILPEWGTSPQSQIPTTDPEEP